MEEDGSSHTNMDEFGHLGGALNVLQEEVLSLFMDDLGNTLDVLLVWHSGLMRIEGRLRRLGLNTALSSLRAM